MYVHADVVSKQGFRVQASFFDDLLKFSKTHGSITVQLFAIIASSYLSKPLAATKALFLSFGAAGGLTTIETSYRGRGYGGLSSKMW